MILAWSMACEHIGKLPTWAGQFGVGVRTQGRLLRAGFGLGTLP